MAVGIGVGLPGLEEKERRLNGAEILGVAQEAFNLISQKTPTALDLIGVIRILDELVKFALEYGS